MEFSKNSRVWVYQSDRELSEAESVRMETLINNFAASWTAHSAQLKAKAEIRYKRFIIFTVDESHAGASGCSIDKSVNFIKQLEQQFNINLLDRFNLAYKAGNKVLSAPRAEFEGLLRAGVIDASTIVFNNLVQNANELETKWEIPFRDSWHMQLFGDMIAERPVRYTVS